MSRRRLPRYGVLMLTAAAARNPNGSWSIGLCNVTADSFDAVRNWSDAEWNREHGGFTPGQTFTVTVRVPELHGRGDLSLAVHRSDATRKHTADGNLTMHDGEITLRLAPLELVTLRTIAP